MRSRRRSPGLCESRLHEALHTLCPKLDAYEAYLKGRHRRPRLPPESLELARRCYEQASELIRFCHGPMDWDFIGFAWRISAGTLRMSACRRVPKSNAHWTLIPPFRRHAVLGYMAAMFDMDWAVAEKHFDFPMAKEASFGLIRPLYGWFQGGAFWRRRNWPSAKKRPLEAWTRMNLHAYLQGAGRGR